jgi:hypothetical protein
MEILQIVTRPLAACFFSQDFRVGPTPTAFMDCGKILGEKPRPMRPKNPLAVAPRPEIVHSSLYLPGPVYEALREAAFKERCKIHDLVMQGIDLALRKRGYPPADELKAGRKR